MFTPKIVRACGIMTKMEATAKISSPTIEGSVGRKYMEPTIKAILPIATKRALKDPILSKGFNGLNSGSILAPRISQVK